MGLMGKGKEFLALQIEISWVVWAMLIQRFILLVLQSLQHLQSQVKLLIQIYLRIKNIYRRFLYDSSGVCS